MEKIMLSAGIQVKLQISLLMISLCSGQVFCEETKEASNVYTIRFGVIEPPVVAQKDITVRAPVSNQSTEAKPLECSGLAWFNGSLLISSDRHEHLVFTCTVNPDTMEFGTPRPWTLIQNEQQRLNDVESVTLLEKTGGTSLYMMCSLSNAPDAQPLPQRRHLYRCNVRHISPFTADHDSVLSMTPLREQLETCFKAINAQPYYAFDADYLGEDKNTYRWGNVEGMTFAPGGQQLLCGMRNPLFDDAAIVFVVSGIPAATEPLWAESLKVTDFFLLDLGSRGISDLFWDPVTQGYLITAGKSNGPRLDPDLPYPPNTLDSALFWWSGHKSEQPILVARIPDMTIEAVCRLGAGRYIVLGSDEGDVSEGRTARQSVLTVLEFTGINRSSE